MDITSLVENDAWQLTTKDLLEEATTNKTALLDTCKALIQLSERLDVVFTSFMQTIESLSRHAPDYIEASLDPDREELKKTHAPHLALIFAFIKLFGKMQGELNKKTRQHLDFFYKKVLNIQSLPAKPDKAHIVFELQKILRDELQKHRVKKGELLKDGKDEKSQDILFATDEEIVVNEAKVVEKRTLFLQQGNVPFKNQQGKIIDGSYIEGVYMALSADKADGIKEEFKDGEPANWYTLGNTKSKFIAPGKIDYQSYPDARLGFILASPVLYLPEGTRTVSMVVGCSIEESTCEALAPYPPEKLMAGVNKILSTELYPYK